MKSRSNFLIVILSLIFCVTSVSIYGKAAEWARKELWVYYQNAHVQRSDINEHLPLLRYLAKDCSSVVEIGLKNMVSSWGLLQGLSESSAPTRSYLGIDIARPPYEIIREAVALAKANEIDFHFWLKNDMHAEIEPADMLFIDSLHTYCHLTYELEKFSPKILKYIAMHDTSEPWGDVNDPGYTGDYSEYPVQIDRTKSGLWTAVEDFLTRHPEWTLLERRYNNHGFTVLKRRS